MGATCVGQPPVTVTTGTASQPHLQGQVVGVLGQVPRELAHTRMRAHTDTPHTHAQTHAHTHAKGMGSGQAADRH